MPHAGACVQSLVDTFDVFVGVSTTIHDSMIENVNEQLSRQSTVMRLLSREELPIFQKYGFFSRRMQKPVRVLSVWIVRCSLATHYPGFNVTATRQVLCTFVSEDGIAHALQREVV